jgi:Flp pilus assembly protein TadD
MPAPNLPADDPDALNNLANRLKDEQHFEQAESLYRQALALRPEFPQALNNLGNLLRNQGELAAASDLLQRASDIWPEQPDIRNNLAVALHDSQRFDEAEAHFRTILEGNPTHLQALNNLGNLLKDLRRPQEAMVAYRRVLALAPEHADARWNLGLLHLQRGDYRHGWALYEARHDPRRQVREVFPPVVNSAPWRGEMLNGKHLLVWHEQGIGDEIQFARFIPDLRDRFAAERITLVCKPPLTRLLRTLSGVDQVLPLGATLPGHDLWVLSGSLPGRFGCTLATLPGRLPYLQAIPADCAKWRQRLPANGRLRVGLVWAGSRWHKNDRNRSLPDLSLLAPLWQVEGIDFYSLQKSPPDDSATFQASAPPPGQPLIHLGAETADFADSAALLGELDLLISVDTAIVHLAGALGRPCWVLLPWQGCDWRWLENGSDTPWYPGSLRLFRQAAEGGWAPLIGQVAAALRHWQARQLALRRRIGELPEAGLSAFAAVLERLEAGKSDITQRSSNPPLSGS